MNLSIRAAASALIKGGKYDQGLLNQVEMAFRAYDPCFACSSHSLPGKTPLILRVWDADGNLRVELRRD